jgi:hypothetical protein
MAALLSFISKRYGKFYVSVVAVNEGDTDPAVAIMGPFDREREAEKWAQKWVKVNDKLAKRGEAPSLIDATTVPDDVRTYITQDLRQVIRERGIDGAARDDRPFGRLLH